MMKPRIAGGRFQPRRMRLFLTDRCVYECDHCMMYGSPKNTSDMPLEDALGYLRSGQDIGVVSATFSGGEPFLKRDNLFTLIEYATKAGMRTQVDTSFIGNADSQIDETAKFLAEHGTLVATSINVYQSRSVPNGLDFLDNKVKMLNALKKYGVETVISVVDAPEAHETAEIFKNITRGCGFDILPPMMDDQFILVDPRVENYGMNMGFQSIMAIGRAYEKGVMNQQDYYDDLAQGGGKLVCTLLGQDGMEMYRNPPDELHIHPDGSVHICCQHEKGVDFGFGNFKEDGLVSVLAKITQHSIFGTNFNGRLNIFKEIVEDKFPEKVPKGGFITGCDVCNMFYRDEEVSVAIVEEMGFESKHILI